MSAQPKLAPAAAQTAAQVPGFEYFSLHSVTRPVAVPAPANQPKATVAAQSAETVLDQMFGYFG